MAGKPQYKAQQFIDAIPGTGGIISTIAKNVGCHWRTVKWYIDNRATVKAAYDAERETICDMAESVVMGNIKIARDKLKDKKQVDSGDAKWYLSRKGKDRGYTERTEITGADGGDLSVMVGKKFEAALDKIYSDE